MKGTEEEVEMGTRDFNGLQINECCRNRRSGQLSAGAGLARQDAHDSELFTILDQGDYPHQRRISRLSAVNYPHKRSGWILERTWDDQTPRAGKN